MKSTTPPLRHSEGRGLAHRAACLLASLALVAGLVPAVALADPTPHDDPSVTVVGTPGAAMVYVDTFGAEAKGKDPSLDPLCNLTFVGPYRFNIAGNTNVFGKYDAKIGQPKSSDPAAEALLPALGSEGGAKVGGETTAATRTNSSSAILEAPEGGSTDNIMAAYLIVTASQHGSYFVSDKGSGAKYPLSKFGFGLKGPQGAVVHYYPDRIFVDTAGTTHARASCFFDVTSFVKKQGYGSYTAVNIPFTAMSDFSASYGSDYFGAWKLVLVEKDAAAPVRMVRLMLGGTSVSNTTPASATISGDGLSIAPNPTGEVLASLDGTDMDCFQKLNLGVDSSAPASVRYVDETGKTLFPLKHFFYFRIFNKDGDVSTNPGPSGTKASTAADTSKNDNVAANTHTYNTDFTLVDLDRLRFGDSGDKKVLDGGEESVKATVSTSDAPTLLSALGLAADILTPTFETSLTVTNLTQRYSSADAGYSLKSDYAQAGDRLKATVKAVNISRDDTYLGLENASITVKAPAFAHIFNSEAEGAKVTARYYSGYGAEADFELFVAELTDDSVVVKTPADAKMKKIKPGGYFEIVFEGTAKGTQTYQEYVNQASLKGAYVDESDGVHSDFVIEDLGLVETKTSSDVPRYPVTASQQGQGTVEVTGQHAPTGLFDADGTARITWEPAAGWRVSAVVVDGVIRDDLLAADSLDLPVAGADHAVMVTFAEDDPAGSDEPGGKPDPGQDVFRIATKGDEGVAFITPTANALKGSSADVTWTLAPGFRLIEVLVDGRPYAAAAGSLGFRDIASNHSVEVRTAADLFTITTVKHGPGAVTDTQVVGRGADAVVSWKPAADARVTRVVVDGRLVYDRAAQALDREPGKPAPEAPPTEVFKDVDADHVVEVTFEDEDAAPPKPDDPDADDPSLLLSTSLVGGAGSISPSTTVEEGATEAVTWRVGDGYLIDRVIVTRGNVSRELDPSEYAVSGATCTLPVAAIRENCRVQVVLTAKERVRDTLYAIETSIYGGPGTITGSMRNLEAHSSGHTVEWAAAAGWRVASVHVDGVPRDDLLTGTSITFDDIAENHRVVVSVQPAETLDATGYYSIDVTCEGNGTAGKSASVAYDGSHTVTWQADADEDVLRVQVDGIERPDLVAGPATASLASPARMARARVAAAGAFTFDGVRSDHKVHVVFSVADPDADRRFNVSTSIGGGAGTISEAVTVGEGASHTVTWTVEEGSVVKAVYVDGVAVPLPKDSSWTFDDIDADHTVRVVLAAAPPETLPDKPPAGYHEVSTGGSGKGEVAPPVHVPGGSSHTVTWEGDGGKPPVMVWVDGKPRPDLVDKGEVTFDDVDGPHEVYVQFEGGEPYEPKDDDGDDSTGGDDGDDGNGGNKPGGDGEGDGNGGSGAGDGSQGGGDGSGSGDGTQGGSGSGSGADGAGGKDKGDALVPQLIALAQTGDGALLLVAAAAVAGSLSVLVLAALRRRPVRRGR